MKALLVVGWIVLVPITWGILTSEVMTSGSKVLQLFGYGAIGFCFATMVTGTLTSYLQSKRRRQSE